jgi:HlyD family secretion protein
VSSERTIKEKTLSLQDLKEGTDELSIRSQQLAVNQKSSALETAREKLSDYSVVAPFDGVISSLDIEKGDAVSSGTTVGVLITKRQMAEVTLNEVDIAKAKVGQKATLTFDAVDGLSLTGKVSEIDAVGTVSQGVVSYSVKIAFDEQDDRVKPGMSATASIITDSRQNVLMVPNAAVKSDNSGSYVEMLPDNGAALAKPARVAVETGLSNDDYTEIKSGLSEGAAVVTGSTTSTAASAAKTTSGFNLFGGGGPR